MAGTVSDIRAGGAYVELSIRDNITRYLDSIAAKLAQWGATLQGVGAAMLAALTPTLSELERRTTLAQWAVRLRSDVTTLSRFSSLLESFGVTADEVGASLEQMTQKLDAKAVDQFGDVLQRLNVRWLTQLPLSDRLSLISQALSRINDPTQRARIAIELFGERVGRAFLLATAQSQQLR